MTKQEKLNRAMKINAATKSFRGFCDLLRKLRITVPGAVLTHYDYNYLKRMGITSKSKGSLLR